MCQYPITYALFIKTIEHVEWWHIILEPTFWKKKNLKHLAFLFC